MSPSTHARNRGGDWWDRLDQLFEEACALPETQRSAFLEGACGPDAELRAELVSLLCHTAPLGDPSCVTTSGTDAGSTVGEPTAVGDELVGRALDHYTIGARLGGGGMGIVYRAQDVLLQRPVALKFLSPELNAVPAARTRFLVEARAPAAIDHPNICTIHEVGETGDGAPFIAMAHYEGETLKERLARGPLPIGEAVDYVLQTAQGVVAAHAHGVLHRDVKPANIFITRDGVAKLIDFGVAKMGDLVLTKAGVALGTVGYMSPEQLRAQSVDARTDIWSLGVVLFESLAGRPPFRGDHPGRIVRSVLLDDPPSLIDLRPGAPLALDALVQRALAKSPEERHPTAAHFVGELRAAAAPWLQRSGDTRSEHPSSP